MKMKRKILAGVVATNMLLVANIANVAAATPLGATVTQDASSPSGYTVSFAFDTNDQTKTIEKVEVTGPFNYFKDYADLKAGFMDGTIQAYAPDEYENGMYPSNLYLDETGEVVASRNIEMTDEDNDGIYEVSFPTTSGSWDYHYTVTYNEDADGDGVNDTASFVDPVNITDIKNSDVNPDLIQYSIYYGMYDDVKQSESPDLSFVAPTSGAAGSLSYEKYIGVLGESQNLGIYLPANYDANREQPYKVIYASHGGGGMETDWFAAAHVDNMMDNMINADSSKEAIVVTMNNSDLGWDFANIEDNVLNYIIPFMEANYNVSTAVTDRAFCGLSMGGMTTTHMYFDHPDAFAYFGIFSGTDMSAVTENFNLDYPTVMIAAGTLDVATRTIMDNPPGRFIKVEDLIDYLSDNGFTNYLDKGLYPGSHDWFVWSKAFNVFASEVCWSNGAVEPPVAQQETETATPVETTTEASANSTTEQDSTIVKTGDNANIMIYSALAIAALAVLIKTTRRSSLN